MTLLNQNLFAQVPVLGMMDLKFNTQTISAEIDSSQVGSLVAGQAVKLVDSAGGVPKVVACTANSDLVFGVIAYDLKDQSFVAGSKVEIAAGFGNVMYLTANGAISRGAKVSLDSSGVGTVVASASGHPTMGWAYDKGVNVGDLIRVYLVLPAYFID